MVNHQYELCSISWKACTVIIKRICAVYSRQTIEKTSWYQAESPSGSIPSVSLESFLFPAFVARCYGNWSTVSKSKNHALYGPQKDAFKVLWVYIYLSLLDWFVVLPSVLSKVSTFLKKPDHWAKFLPLQGKVIEAAWAELHLFVYFSNFFVLCLWLCFRGEKYI